VLKEISKNCQDSDLVGITLMTSAFLLATNITEYLKKNNKAPVIWGGIHPTIMPEECLEHADMICIGEGETPLLNLVERLEKNQDSSGVEGIWLKRDGGVIKNRIPPLIQDLDSLALDTYESQDDKVLQKEKLINTDRLVASELLGTQLTLFFSRGCPYRCAFCCNNVLNELYKGQRIVRHKSPELVIEEINRVLSNFKKINRVFFSDDSFITMPFDDLNKFCQLYKKHVGLPFSCQVTAPSVTEDKIKALVGAGLNDVRMGLQSASPRILELYKRPISARIVKESSLIINKCLGDSQILSFDLILDNPYETKEDLLITLRFLLNLPRPYTLRFFSLQLYPGTELYNKVIEGRGDAKKFRDAYRGSYRSAEGSYINFLFYLMKLIGLKRCPVIIGSMLFSKNMLFILDNPVVDAAIKGIRNTRSLWRYSLKLRIKFLKRQAPPLIKKGYTNL
jgi:radical SAM superfamily enzyme YgiQ (UPF0313 family)